jgi:predicted RNA-binding Zn ribbon-like protein
MIGSSGGAGVRHVPAPGEDVSCALALVNTRRVDSGQQVDLITDASRAGDWLAGNRLLPQGSAVHDADAERLAALRETIRALFSARAEQRAPAPDDLSAMNAALAGAPLVPALTWDDAGPQQSTQLLGPAADPVGVALARLAGDALGLLTSAEDRVPAPCGAHGCIRWFLRTHAARQWCSARCGDRVRAARHYARHHQP